MTLAGIRTATSADAPLVATLQLTVWQHAYSELLPASVVLGDPTVLAPRWADRITTGGPVLLALEGSETVGFVALSADDGTDAGAGDGAEVGAGVEFEPAGEIEQLLVVPRWTRRGHGGRLLGAAADLLRQNGYQRGNWWAPDTDRAVERFLAGVGWFPDGASRGVDTGEQVFTELRYAGPLDLRLR